MERVFRVDPHLLSEVRAYGPFDPNACFNCGTCTLSCDLATGAAAFPRRLMQYVLLGLEDKVLAGLEPWLCQDCGDCSTACPRDAKPRTSMGTLRRYLAARYAWSGIGARISRSEAWSVGALSSVALLVPALALAYHLAYSGMPVSELAATPMGLDHMFPMITWFTLAVIFLPAAVLLSHGVRMHRFTMGHAGAPRAPASLYLAELKTLLVNAFTQKRMADCPGRSRKVRWVKHLMLASGGMLMFVLLAFFLRFFQTDALYPVSHPQRWLGYIATVFLAYGSADILVGRVRRKKALYEHTDWRDYTLPVLILLTAASGIAVHAARYAGIALAAHYLYLLHLMISVPALVVEVPFGRWSHAFYRPLALYFQSVREKALALEAAGRVEAA
ncbi:MAG: 4Fe-4S dicluster domain-containing protein [Gemmatimonadota bacterium]